MKASAFCLFLCVAMILAAPVAAERHLLKPFIVRTVSKGEEGLTGVARVSNARHHLILVRFEIPEGEWWGRFCARCTGPNDRLPLRVEVRPLTIGWGAISQYRDVVHGDWYVPWTDGYDMYVDGPGWYCVKFRGELSWWKDHMNFGVAVMEARSPEHPTAGRTYRFAPNDFYLYVCEGECG